MDLINTDWF